MRDKELLCRIRYYEESDEYRLELWDNEYQSWRMSRAVKCVHSKEFPDELSANYVHYTILAELIHCVNLGYRVVS